jgi:hypothetical protein
MSSRVSGSGRGALFGTSAALAQRHVEERDIEAELDGLGDRVSRLRRVVGAIDEETRAHTSLVAELEGTMLRAQAALKETLRKMNRTYNAGGGGCVRVCTALHRASASPTLVRLGRTRIARTPCALTPCASPAPA